MKINTDEVADNVVSSLKISLSELALDEGKRNDLSGVIEIHPCHGMVAFHLATDLDPSNIDIDSFTFQNIGGFNLSGWGEEYLESGVLNIDGVEAGGAFGDIDVEQKVFTALGSKLRNRLSCADLPIEITKWLLIVGYSNDGLI